MGAIWASLIWVKNNKKKKKPVFGMLIVLTFDVDNCLNNFLFIDSIPIYIWIKVH